MKGVIDDEHRRKIFEVAGTRPLVLESVADLVVEAMSEAPKNTAQIDVVATVVDEFLATTQGAAKVAVAGTLGKKNLRSRRSSGRSSRACCKRRMAASME